MKFGEDYTPRRARRPYRAAAAWALGFFVCSGATFAAGTCWNGRGTTTLSIDEAAAIACDPTQDQARALLAETQLFRLAEAAQAALRTIAGRPGTLGDAATVHLKALRR